MANLNVKLKVAWKRAVDFSYEHDVPRACLQQSQSEQEKMRKIVTCDEDASNHFNAHWKKDWKYLECHSDEEGLKLRSQLGV